MQYNQPGDQPSNPNAPYVDGNPAAGIQGSIVPAAAVEFDQREVVEVITRANVRAYSDFSGNACAIPSNADQTQLRKAIEGFITNWQFIINTPITFKVHGPGADFADLNAAMDYLMKYRFGRGGFCTLQLQAGSYTYINQLVSIAHPQNDRIGIIGAPMKAPVPIHSSAYAQNGNTAPIRANDTAINLAMLRNCFGTELHFTNGGAIVIELAPLGFLDGILFTGDGTYTGVSDAQLVSWTAASAATAAWYTTKGVYLPPQGISNGIAAVGGGYGFTVICGGACFFGTNGPIIALGNHYSGIVGNARSYMCAAAQPAVISLGNGGDGITVSDMSTLYNWNGAVLLASCNGGQGITVADVSNFQWNGLSGQFEIKNNGAWGLYSVAAANLQLYGNPAVISGNGSGAAYAVNNSQITIGTSSVSGPVSPPLNNLSGANNMSCVTN